MINNSYSNEGAVESSKPAGINKRSNSDRIQGLKKGPWTAAEDAILTEYVRKHGEGNWNSVQKNSGLMRCGKSCRLRWANHLRPNLKKGSFTPEEERIIIELHAKIGNKWARMATQLPGRTDNEIKNFWNTRMKRRRRAGLPVYPHEVQKEVAAPYQFQPQQQQQEQEPQRQPNSSSASLSSLLSPTHQNASFIPPLSMFDPINFTSAVNPMQNHLGSAVYSNPNHQFKLFGNGSCNHGAGLPALPHSPVSPYLKPPPPPSTLLNQNPAAQAMPTSPSTPQPVQYSPSNFANNISFTSLIMGGQFEEVGLSHDGLKPELPSNQTLPQAATPVSSNASAGPCLVAVSGKTNNLESTETILEDDKNSGLLESLLMEAKTLSSKGTSKNEKLQALVPVKGKRVMEESADEEEEEVHATKRVKLYGETSDENQGDDISFAQSSIGTKEPVVEEINSMDDDLSSLLSNFPSSMPLPEWYPRSRNVSGESETGDHEAEEDGSVLPQVAVTRDASPNLEWALGSGYWNNMPSIC